MTFAALLVIGLVAMGAGRSQQTKIKIGSAPLRRRVHRSLRSRRSDRCPRTPLVRGRLTGGMGHTHRPACLARRKPDLQQTRAHLKLRYFASDGATVATQGATEWCRLRRPGWTSFLKHLHIQLDSVTPCLVENGKQRQALGLDVFLRVHTPIHREHATARDNIEVGTRFDATADQHERSSRCVRRHVETSAAPTNAPRQALQARDDTDRVFECVSSLV